MAKTNKKLKKAPRNGAKHNKKVTVESCDDAAIRATTMPDPLESRGHAKASREPQAAAEKVLMTDEEIALCRAAVHQTYQVIADDAGIPETAKPAAILEVVLDADYVRTYGKLSDYLYDRMNLLVRHELANSKSFKAGMKKLVPVLWDAPKGKPRFRIMTETMKPDAPLEVVPEGQAEIDAAADGTGVAKAAALRAEAEANTPTVEAEPASSTLPVDPKAPVDSVFKPCPVCQAVQVPKSWHFCNSCWAVRKAEKAAAKQAAAPATA
jgi:hypothetical protein